MHELSLCLALVDRVSEIAAREGAGRVERVEVAVGALSGVEPDALTFWFGPDDDPSWVLWDARGNRIADQDDAEEYIDNDWDYRTTWRLVLPLAGGAYALTNALPYGMAFELEELDGRRLAGTDRDSSMGFKPLHAFTVECSQACGDGVVQAARGEVCDDANVLAGDGCTADCQPEAGAACGDGVLMPQLGEMCDDGNAAAGDGCGATCITEFCGDGIVQPYRGEVCDDGNDDPNDACRGCQVNRCGNGWPDPGEECDWARAEDAAGCDKTCRWGRCLYHDVHVFFLDPTGLLNALKLIPGLGQAVIAIKAVALVGVLQTLQWAIRDETRERWAELTMPLMYGVGTYTVTKWPGYGVSRPGGGGNEWYESVLGYIVEWAFKKTNPFASVGADFLEFEHEDILLRPGTHTFKQYLTPGFWVFGWVHLEDALGHTFSVTDGTTFEVGCEFQCGDGVVQRAAGEECDDGNAVGGDGCDAACRWETLPMRALPGGAFVMGSDPDEYRRDDDEGRHPVRVGPFEIGVFEVTRGEFRALMGYSTWDEWFWADGDPWYEPFNRRSPQNASFAEAVAFANRLSTQRGLETCYTCGSQGCIPRVLPRKCRGYRLPTEAEWEYAARELGRETGPWLSRAPLADQAQTEAEESHNNWSMMWPVGGKAANAQGLYDMLGNAAEWVHDRYGAYPGPVDGQAPPLLDNPSGPEAGSQHVLRGGPAKWFWLPDGTSTTPGELRLGARLPVPEGRYWGSGFRLARTLPECATGFWDCDGNEANGCEADLASSTATCGACETRCVPANAEGAACVEGRCVFECKPGWEDRDGNPANGCEWDATMPLPVVG